MAKGQVFKWTPERHITAIEMRERGESLETIGTFLGCSISTVRTHLQEHGLDTSRMAEFDKKSLPESEIDRIEEDLKNGVPVREIAARYEMSYTHMLTHIIHRTDRLKAVLRSPGAAKATPIEQELAKLERWGKYNLPIVMIATGLKRSEKFLREKLFGDEDNQWKEAYYNGRIAAGNLTAVLFEKNLNNSFASEKEMSPTMVQAAKHWDNRMNEVGEKMSTKVETTTRQGASVDPKTFEKMKIISDRQMQLIMSGKIDEADILSMDKWDIIKHGRQYDQMTPEEFEKFAREP